MGTSDYDTVCAETDCAGGYLWALLWWVLHLPSSAFGRLWLGQPGLHQHLCHGL